MLRVHGGMQLPVEQFKKLDTRSIMAVLIDFDFSMSVNETLTTAERQLRRHGTFFYRLKDWFPSAINANMRGGEYAKLNDLFGVLMCACRLMLISCQCPGWDNNQTNKRLLLKLGEMYVESRRREQVGLIIKRLTTHDMASCGDALIHEQFCTQLQAKYIPMALERIDQELCNSIFPVKCARRQLRY
jgi:hypothetical protein